MAQGKVTVNNLNLGQGEFPEIERTLLFIGTAPLQQGKVVPVNTQTDFDAEFGTAESVLKTNLKAALVNAGQNWQAYAMPVAANADYIKAIDTAMTLCSPEGIVIVDPTVSAPITLNAYQAKLMELRATYGRFLFLIAAGKGINAATQTWADYLADMTAIIHSVSANMVLCVPQLHANDAGALAGRLCNRSVSVADTPMRVATGPVLGLGDIPVDKNGVALPESTLAALDAIRYTTVQHYPDYPGVFFGDGNMLEEPTGDYKVIEYARVMLKAMRAVRLLAIQRIGNRLLNSTASSIAAHKQYFARPLREMSKSVVFAGYTFPGEIEPPTDSSVQIVWQSKTHVEIYLQLQPYNCPKTITANLVLDLSNEVSA